MANANVTNQRFHISCVFRVGALFLFSRSLKKPKQDQGQRIVMFEPSLRSVKQLNNFDECLLLGVGGFGKVYKRVLENEAVVVIKRANPRAQQGLNEFRTEIQMLSKLRHRTWSLLSATVKSTMR
ncbi:hypothetical protein RJ641_036122 [Dillenia turbinata]|uniref:Protein kinase domain-containing protein n=1 Tax=Dillenia turbinata TaxID=194707 RepID=A0AAN8ZGM5_9MAGN